MTHGERAAGFAAIDFGTSNSAVALPRPGGEDVELVELEPGQPTMPTAVFYRADTPPQQPEAERLYGRAAIAAYVAGDEGRLMRSMKSLLGAALLDEYTDIGGGRRVRYRDVVTGYLRELRRRAEARAGHALHRVVLGRPVFFVDDDPARDAAAQAALEAAAREVGFDEVLFQFEPIAAALDQERRVAAETLVLVADIGGGTSDFSLLRIGPQRARRAERRDDILAAHGVHVAGTDFDRHVELRAILPLLGYGSRRPPQRPGETPRELPSGLFHDLATWHLINTCYAPQRVAEWRGLRGWFADPAQHRRLVRVLQERLGHALAAAAEAGKIAVAQRGDTRIALDMVEAGLAAPLAEADAALAIEADLQRIVDAAQQTLRLGGVAATDVGLLYFTGGSTGLAPLVRRIADGFPAAQSVVGDRFASVAQGLGLHARRVFGG